MFSFTIIHYFRFFRTWFERCVAGVQLHSTSA